MDDVDAQLEETIQQQVEEWSSNSNACFSIELIRGDGSTAASFGPEFTYPIFGEEEAIFGYQGLNIALSFAAHNLRPHLSVSYDKKFERQGEVEPTDIHDALKPFLAETAFSNAGRKKALEDVKAKEFVPPGEKVHQYESNGQHYEIWCASLADPEAKELLENMQVLVPMFIEGGTMLQLEQDWTVHRWKLFLLYQVDAETPSKSYLSPYSLIGYGTSYRVFTFPDRYNPSKADLDLFSPSAQPLDNFIPPRGAPSVPNNLAPSAITGDMSSPLDFPSRERLSQFLIFPTYQGGGHGAQLYTTMYKHLSQPDNVREFTVEDPNEAFDDLRDVCDLLHLRANVPEFAALRINSNIEANDLSGNATIPTSLIVPVDVRNSIMAATKLMQRQFDRLVEMHTLSFIPALHRTRSRITRKYKATNPHDRSYYFWRLYAKQRLYIFNRDSLSQVEREERVEKLEAALDSVQEAYAALLEKVESRENTDKESSVNPLQEHESQMTNRPRKRKVVDDDDELWNEDGVAGTDGSNDHKQSRAKQKKW